MPNAADFLIKHDMYFRQIPFEPLVSRFRHEMTEGLAGRVSSLYMLPTYLRADLRPRRGESVLVLDAGGTNLRAGRVRFAENGVPVVEALEKCPMPGTAGGEIHVEELFAGMAALAAGVADGCRRACVSFSYVFDARPDGDGRIRQLCKELRVRGAKGSLLCAPLERAMQARGVPGTRRWRVVNDAVGSLLGGMAMAEPEGVWDDYIGFILGTGFNTCCRLPAVSVIKSPETGALGGDTIVNMESGCFVPPLLGDGDRALDAASQAPGDHLAEKMTGGGYYPALLRQTLQLAAAEKLLSPETGRRLAGAAVTSRDVDDFCGDPAGPGLLAGLFADAGERALAAEINDALSERAARLMAACICAVLDERGLSAGSRVCLCADGTTLRKSPVLRPKTEAYLRGRRPDILTEFRFTADATLLGGAWAGLIG